MDLQSEIARLVIEKGGSIVQANPEEEGSENITSILIDDKVYKISIEGIGDLERRIETVETDKADELTMNTGINISDWDRDIDPDVPVIVDKYTNYHDAVSKISQQIDVMGNRTDDLKTSLNELPKIQHLTGTIQITAPTTISKVANITVPKGFNIIRVYAHYANNRPTQLALGYGNTGYENLGNVVPASGMTPQDLSLTTAVKYGTANSINVYAKYDNAGSNSIGYDILNIDI